MVNMNTLERSTAQEIGDENIAYQTWEKLQLASLLLSQGFTQEQAILVATQFVNRAVYPASDQRQRSGCKKTQLCASLSVLI